MNHVLTWSENGLDQSKVWVSEGTFSAPKKIHIADDTLKADIFYRQASEGAAFIYRGDFQNAKQLLQAVGRRIEKALSHAKAKLPTDPSSADMKALFHRYRQSQAHRAQLLSRILLEVESDLSISLGRAPDASAAIAEALGQHRPTTPFLLSLRELLGYIGAHEWRKKGVDVPALGAKIHPHYGLFSPARGEYLDLIAEARLPANIKRAVDVGTGTGVIAAILARRLLTSNMVASGEVPSIVATDLDPRAIVCARENIERLGFSKQIEVVQADLFAATSEPADLIVCNPPWVPARATSALERAVYDEDSRMLKGFLAALPKHLSANGEAWLILSDLAEHLGLRGLSEVEDLIAAQNLKVVEKISTKPRHAKSADRDNWLFTARSKEQTFLWRLKK
jgi:methylase of polypeptide subunit release factors